MRSINNKEIKLYGWLTLLNASIMWTSYYFLTTITLTKFNTLLFVLESFFLEFFKILLEELELLARKDSANFRRIIMTPFLSCLSTPTIPSLILDW